MRLLTLTTLHVANTNASIASALCLIGITAFTGTLYRVAYRTTITWRRSTHQGLRFRVLEQLVAAHRRAADAVMLANPVTPMTVVRR